MFMIDYKSRTPLYQQIVDNVERLALSGLLPPGGQLPSVRSLAVELSINPNTIARAYAELENRGVIYSRPGRGSFMADNTEALRQLGREQLRGRGMELSREARRLRFDRGGFLDFCGVCWDSGESEESGQRAAEKEGKRHD